MLYLYNVRGTKAGETGVSTDRTIDRIRWVQTITAFLHELPSIKESNVCETTENDFN